MNAISLAGLDLSFDVYTICIPEHTTAVTHVTSLCTIPAALRDSVLRQCKRLHKASVICVAMPSTTTGFPISLGVIIGVTVAGCVLLFILVLVPTVVILNRRHKLALAEFEQGRITRDTTPNIWDAGLPPRASRLGKRQSQIRQAGWTGLSSNEKLGGNGDVEGEVNAAAERRKSTDVISWPLPGSGPSRAGTPLRSSEDHLGVLTHPTVPNQTGLAISPSLAIPTASSHLPAQALPKLNSSRSPSPDTWITNTLRPPPLFSPRVSTVIDMRHSKSDRSFSVPSLLTSKSDNAAAGTTKCNKRAMRHPRSFSLGAQDFPQPSELLAPPLPSLAFSDPYVHRRIQGRSLLRRSNSDGESAVSSIFNFGEAIDSGDNHIQSGQQDANWDVQACRNDDPEKTVVAGPRPMHNAAPNSESCSLYPPTFTSAQEQLLQRARTPNNAVPSTAKDVDRFEHGELHTAESVRMSKISNSPGQPDFISTIHVLSTPRRQNTSMRRVSIYGSPYERKRTSVLQDISGNESTLPRALSQASIITPDSDDRNNPFNLESPVLPRSSLRKKSSGSKTTRKRCTVRIFSIPTIIDPPSRPISLSRMNGIVEESLIKEPQSFISRNDPGNGEALHRPPSTSIFAPDLNNMTTSLRASLTPSSPTLSFVPYNQENEVPSALEFGPESHVVASATHFPAISSPYSSINTATPSQKLHQKKQKSTSHSLHEIRPQRPTTPPIPGLTLLAQGGYAPELCYPTIEISGSPGEREQASNVSSPFQAYPTPPEAAENESPSVLVYFKGLLPSAKATATTQITQPENMQSSTIRPTPLSSIVHPLNTKPYLAPPHNSTSAILNHPHGPRPLPGQDVMRSIRVLRRENSDAMAFKDNSRGARRYLGLGREPSPNLSNSNMLSVEEDDDERERIRISSVWDDGEEFWGPSQGVTAFREKHGLGKNLGWEDENGLRIFVPEASPGLYDASGFLRA